LATAASVPGVVGVPPVPPRPPRPRPRPRPRPKKILQNKEIDVWMLQIRYVQTIPMKARLFTIFLVFVVSN
jgi:hypothetical protein